MFKKLICLLSILLLSWTASVWAASDTNACYNYLNASDYARAVDAAKQVLKSAPSDWNGHYCLGRAYLQTGELKLALREFKAVERLSTAKADLQVVFNRLGLVYSGMGDLENAYLSHNRALTLAREMGKRDQEGTALNNLAIIFHDRGDLDKALDYYLQSLDLKDGEVGKVPTYSNIALVYSDKGDQTKAIEYLQKAIAIDQRAGAYHQLGMLQLNLGTVYRQAKKLDLAEESLQNGLTGVQKVGDRFWEATAYQCLAELRRDQGNIKGAKELLVKAYVIAKAIGATGKISSIASTYAAIDQLEKSHTYAGIEIGAKGVKAMVLALSPGKDGKLNYEEKFRKSINTNVISGVAETGEFKPEAIEETAQAVKTLFETMKAENKLADEDILIVGSSAVAEGANRFQLTDRIRKLIGKETAYISVTDEVTYNIAGALPARDRTTGLSIDIGSGNTKIGYVVASNGQWNPVAVEIPFGSVSFTDAVNAAKKEGESFAAAADRLAIEKVAPDYAKYVRQYPSLNRRNPVYLVGGAVWAMATLIHPERIQDAFVKLTPDDLKTYYRRLADKPAQVLDPDLSNIKDAKTREKALEQIRAVNKTFTRDNLIAGARILKVLADEMKLANRDLYFPRYGGWLLGYVMTAGVSDIKSSVSK